MKSIPLAILLCLAAAACSKDHCTVADCTTLVATCRVDLVADGFEACVRKGLHNTTVPDVSGCVQACEGTGASDLVGCYASHADTCATASPAECKTPTRSSTSCTTACHDSRGTCEAACSSTEWASCLSCATGCGITEHNCLAACP